MGTNIAALLPMLDLSTACVFLAACHDGNQSSSASPEQPQDEGSGGSMVSHPLDLVYVCGNKFLATNSSSSVLHVTYRVVGTRETGSLTLSEGPGGDPSRGTSFDDQTRPVRAAELWNPVTGAWTTLASNAVTRTYHGTSILLRDGRVLHAGSGSSRTPHELNAELFSPPYLFKGARPTISSAPTAVRYGTSFSVGTAQAQSISRVSLIRLGSTTHAFDMNQRFQRLSFTRQSGALTVTAPISRNRTPPGHYMLFILNGDGVPSVARIVRVR